MGNIRKLLPAKLVIVLLKSTELNIRDEVLDYLEKKVGKIDFISGELAFDTYTYYYNKEMGNNIMASIISFSELIHPSELSYIKNFTNSVETIFSNNNKRTVNIDPGYFYGAQFVLATTKPREFRSYLGRGIWSEPVYFYSKKELHPFSTTYPNYKSIEYIKVFDKIRKQYIDDTKIFRGEKIEKE